MLYHLDVEDIEPNHWVAYVYELPGCFSMANTYEEAVACAPSHIAAHFAWLLKHGSATRLSSEPIEVTVAEVCRSFTSEGDYLVNAFFAHDREPLSDYDVRAGLSLLESTRRDLLELIQPLSDEQLSQALEGEMQQSIEGILNHLAWAERW
jgi:predicted RNase H-like HicB family nuclease